MSMDRAMKQSNDFKVQIADDRLGDWGFDLPYVLDQLYDAQRQPLTKSMTLLFRAGDRMDMETFIKWLDEDVVQEIRLEMPGSVPFDVVAFDCICTKAVQTTVEGVLVWEVTFSCGEMENVPVDLSPCRPAPANTASVTSLCQYRRDRTKA